jgi:dTDP-4-amino-4,6-dideoxygalactose transaminase
MLKEKRLVKTQYNPWPSGGLPQEWQRPEISILKKKGYDISDPRDAVQIFEQKVAAYAGAKYAVSVDSCTNALFLCLQFIKKKGSIPQAITIPKRTYVSVPMAIINAGYSVRFEDIQWQGVYRLSPTHIYDSAVRFRKNMYVKDSLQCLSFQIKKHLPIGKGGMILTDQKTAYDWLKAASYEGRHLSVAYDKDQFETIGWNMYMTPEDAARGILLLDQISVQNDDLVKWNHYTDLSLQPIFAPHISHEQNTV